MNGLAASFAALTLALSVPALAAGPAAPGTPVDKAGQVILEAVAGRSYAEAFAKSQSPTNPFGIDLDRVAAAAGAEKANGDLAGGAAKPGQLSILPQFNTPDPRFGMSDISPAIIPFAANIGGTCLGGYATGYPTPDRVIALDMADLECSAAAIARQLAATYPLKEAMQAKPSPKSATGKPVLGEPKSAAPDTSFRGPTAVAAPGSDVDRVGQQILSAVAGRTAQQALDGGAPKDNPFELDADPLLLAAGVYFIADAGDGHPLEPSELSIFPDYVTPGAKFTPSDKTPPIMPFAFNRGGICFGGYVTGYPVPDKVFALDMHGRTCSARTVDEVMAVEYASRAGRDAGSSVPSGGPAAGQPAGASAAGGTDETVFDGVTATDHDLERIAYGAYAGAYNQALKHGNFFSSGDLNYAALRSAMRNALEKEGYGAANVETSPAASIAAAKACATDGRIGVRVAFNSNGI
ncbi:MAG: hypothetical protein ACTHOR_17740, partial [Devosia sp.]